MLAGVEDVADVFLLLRVELSEGFAGEELAESENGVHRRPELVTHGAEEIRFGLACLLGLLQRRREPLLLLDQLRRCLAELLLALEQRRVRLAPLENHLDGGMELAV